MRNSSHRVNTIQLFLKKRENQWSWRFYKNQSVYTNVINKYCQTGNKQYLEIIKPSVDSIHEWRILLQEKRNTEGGWEIFEKADYQNSIKEKLFTYCAWARSFARDDSDYTALAAGVVILDGYRFDFETGDYQLNDIGKMGVEFVAEFPNPQTAFFLKTIRNGGNQEYVDNLLEKFGNRDTWEELFKTAKPPEK